MHHSSRRTNKKQPQISSVFPVSKYVNQSSQANISNVCINLSHDLHGNSKKTEKSNTNQSRNFGKRNTFFSCEGKESIEPDLIDTKKRGKKEK